MAAASEAVAMGAQMAVTTAVANPMGAQITVTAPTMGGQMAVAAATPVVVRSLFRLPTDCFFVTSHTIPPRRQRPPPPWQW